MKGQVGKIETLSNGEVKLSIYLQKEQIPPDLMAYNFETVTIKKGEAESIDRLEFYKGMKGAMEVLVEAVSQEIESYDTDKEIDKLVDKFVPGHEDSKIATVKFDESNLEEDDHSQYYTEDVIETSTDEELIGLKVGAGTITASKLEAIANNSLLRNLPEIGEQGPDLTPRNAFIGGPRENKS